MIDPDILALGFEVLRLQHIYLLPWLGRAGLPFRR